MGWKTSTLRCIAGLEIADGGTISADGEVLSDTRSGRFVPSEQRNMGMVFQSYAIWPHMTVFENVAFPLRVRRQPKATIEKPPSAELRPDQKDSDSLPPYEILDAVLEDYVEDSHPAEQIAKDRGFDIEVVRRVIRLVDRAEYKRQQAAPGLKISPKAFGVGRRLPIAAKSEA